MLATGIVLALVVQIINVVVFTYGKGSVRTALDEAARAGARQGVTACEVTGDQVLHEAARWVDGQGDHDQLC